MATWQPPIPSGALYSKAARALGPALPLLAYCYDKVKRDGWFEISLKEVASDMDESYQTIKRHWWALKDGPFFVETVDQGRKGWRVRFKDVWLDWRILAARQTEDKFSRSDEGTKDDLEDMPETTNEGTKENLQDADVSENTAQGHFKVISRSNEGTPRDLETSGNKVLMISDQADHVGALPAPPLGAIEPPKTQPPARGKRDPNQQHPACLAFFQKTGYRPNRQQAADISATVNDLDAWQVAIGAWLSRGNRINDAGGMLDWYLHPDRQTNARSNGHGKAQPVRPRTGEHFERAIWREARIEDVI